MPTRLLRDYTDSLKFDGISPEAERLFVRLITKADDYGRYTAEARLLKAGCFPLENQIRPNDLARWLDELSHRQLILRYEVKGRSLLALVNFRQRLKNSRPKFPPPSGQSDSFQPTSGEVPPLPATSRNSPPHSETHSEAETESNSEREAEPRKASKLNGRHESAPAPLSHPIDPPPGWPRTEDEAFAAVQMQGAPREVVVEEWQRADALGGCNSKGTPIRKWPSHFAAVWSARRSREAEQSARARTRPAKDAALARSTAAERAFAGEVRTGITLKPRKLE